MKLNKFLVAAAAVAVLPLSVANAEEPTSSNGPALVQPENPPYAVNGPSEVNQPVAVGLDGKPTTGVNGPAAVNDVKPYGASVVKPLVNEKPEYKVSSTTKNTAPAKTDKVQKALPKTSAVK